MADFAPYQQLDHAFSRRFAALENLVASGRRSSHSFTAGQTRRLNLTTDL